MSLPVAFTFTVGSQKERSQPVRSIDPKAAIASMKRNPLFLLIFTRTWLTIGLDPISEGLESPSNEKEAVIRRAEPGWAWGLMVV